MRHRDNNNIAMALAMLFGGGRLFTGEHNLFHKKYGGRFGPYRPHQSTRERSRRIGGETWRAFKAADRDRRGLAPNKD